MQQKSYDKKRLNSVLYYSFHFFVFFFNNFLVYKFSTNFAAFYREIYFTEAYTSKRL